MNLLIDSWSTQVLYQQAPPSYPAGCEPPPPVPGAPVVTGMRLNTLFGAMKSIGFQQNPWNVSFTTPPITASQLDGMDVYVSLTRYQGAGFAYAQSELNAIEAFVQAGGNVLLMTNHGGMPSAPKDDWTANDAVLACLFNVTLEDYYVAPHAAGSSEVITISDSSLNGSAGQMMAHDSCIIVPPASGVTTVAEFPTGWQAWSQKTGYITPPTPYFAALVPYSQTAGVGSLLVIGNSGWLADEGSPMPAPGLAPYYSNLQFALNCIGYMGTPATQSERASQAAG